MKYRVQKEMRFVRNWRSKEMIVIEAGTIVDGVHHSQMSTNDKDAFRHMERRLRKENPTKRYAFFRYGGEVRAALAMDELSVVRT